MAKYYGKIGFAEQKEASPGVWEEIVTERNYSGDLLGSSRMLQNSGQLNDDINVSNKISIIADPFVNANLSSMRYVEYMGAKWEVTTVSVEYPRLILTIGGLYNGA